MTLPADLDTILSGFDAISLSELSPVNLLSRSEKKFVLPLGKLKYILKEALPDHRILEISGHRLLEYRTEYFDTPENAMYFAHHNGRPNRFKVRMREYVVSGEQYLEVKKRVPDGRTQKKRVKFKGSKVDYAFGEQFIRSVTPYRMSRLEMKLVNRFHRITLVNRSLSERITIDIGLEFRNDRAVVQLPAIVIIEIKSGAPQGNPGFEMLLKKNGVHGTGLSKYCIGRAMLEPGLKSGIFQNKIRYLIKLNAASMGATEPGSKGG